MRTSNHQGWVTIRIDSPKTAEVQWSVLFEPADSYRYPTKAPTGLRVEPVGLNGGHFTWGAQYYLNSGYQIYLDGQLLGYTGSTSFPFRGLDPARTYTAEVKAVWDDGTIGPTHAKSELKFSLLSLLPDEVPLAGLTPVPAADRGAGRFGGRGGPSGSLSISGKRFEGGLTARGGEETAYDIEGLFSAFAARVGVADGYEGTLSFAVVGDGRELWNSGPMKKSDPLKPVQVDIAGVKRLVLRTTTVSEPPQVQGQGRGRGMGARLRRLGWTPKSPAAPRGNKVINISRLPPFPPFSSLSPPAVQKRPRRSMIRSSPCLSPRSKSQTRSGRPNRRLTGPSPFRTASKRTKRADDSGSRTGFSKRRPI